MSTLGWIALVLAALVVAVLIGTRFRSARGAAGSPRTVAELVLMRAERAEPSPTVVVPRPRSAESEPEPVDAQRTPEGRAAAARVPASADDTPWNRAARIAASDGVVWATDHSANRVRLPAFPPELVDTRTTAPTTADRRPAPDDAEPDRPDGAAGPAAVDEPARPTAEADAEAGRARPDVAAEAGPAGPDIAAGAGPGTADVPDVAASGPDRPAPDPAMDADGAPSAPAAVVPGEPASEAEGDVSAGPEPLRARRGPTQTAAEQAAVDLALLRTFGCAAPGSEPATVSLEGACCVAAAPEAVDGAAQPVAFRVVGRDGAGVPGARVTLLDDRGRDAAGAAADAEGRGTVLAPRPGSYVLVSAAADHQPGAVALAVAGEPVAADLLLARSASLSGTVHGADGPAAGARLTLVQDGEIVDTAISGPDGAYRIADLAAGGYGLSVTAGGCGPVAVLVDVPEETDHRHDVELDHADGVMIGLG